MASQAKGQFDINKFLSRSVSDMKVGDKSSDSSAVPSPEPNRKVQTLQRNAGRQDSARLSNRQWQDVQRKTFTKWVNNQLEKAKIEPVESMVEEFSDGAKLIQLLEVIGDESMGKYYKAPKFRVQKCENVNKALEFIKSHNVSLTNIGAEDLVDKNEKLVLGMIWTIILRWTIAEISEEGLTAKEGLLLWCQRKTAGYKNVNIKDFSFSWQDGLGFCALIHRYRPDLLEFDQLKKSSRASNLQLAFDIAETHLGIPKLLDVEDMVDMKPDERSVITYVAQYFHAFSALDKVEVAGRRVAKFANVLQGVFGMRNDYEKRATDLLSSFSEIQVQWEQSHLENNYAQVKQDFEIFMDYKNNKKREWITEKRALDSLLSNIQTKLKTYNLASYTPPGDTSPESLDKAWSVLLQAETSRASKISQKIAVLKAAISKKYADIANKFENELNAISLALSALDGDLEGQKQEAEKLSGQVDSLSGILQEAHEANNQCLEAGIDEIDRADTVYSIGDLEFDFELVKASLQKKLGFIENQMVARTLTNVTPQLLEEFESTFRAFDKDQSNSLSAFEFKACLASLGKAYEDEEFDELFAKLSENDETLSFEQFTNYMVSITEDRVTPEQLRESFNEMSGGKNYITEADMRTCQVPEDQIDYLKSVIPASTEQPEGGLDYEAYLEKVFQN